MPRGRKNLSVFTWTYLDLVVTLFAVILCLFVLVALDSGRQAAVRAGRFAVLAVQFVGKGADGKPDPGVVLRGRVELLAPPAGSDGSGAAPGEVPAGWGCYLLPHDRAAARPLVDDVSAEARGGFAYCILRGVKPDHVLLRLSFYAVEAQDRQLEVEVRGWVADPRAGKRPIARALVAPLCVGLAPSSGPAAVLATPGREALYRAAVVVRADMDTPPAPPAGAAGAGR